MANVLGNYELLEQIGSGATGRVWRARRLDTDALFALKELRGDLADDPEVRSRFLNEEAILADRRLPGVVRVHGTVVDGDRLGLVMDLVEGPDLREVIASSGPLTPARACALAGQLAETLAAAHASGLIHRDVKPANVMVVDQAAGPGLALLTDFGLARVLEETGSTASRSQALGTPDYVAPEVLEGGRAGSPADIYALGVMLFEMTLGWRPFRRRSLAALMAQHLHESPERPAGIDENLWRVITRCLEKDPKARPTARVLGNELKALTSKLVDVAALPRTDPPEQQEKTRLKRLPSTSEVKPATLSLSGRTQRIIAASFVGLVAVAVTAYAAIGSPGRVDNQTDGGTVSAATVEAAAPNGTDTSSASAPSHGTPTTTPPPAADTRSGSGDADSNEGKDDRAEADRARANRAEADKAKADRARAAEAEADRAKADKAKADRARAAKAEADRAKADRAKAEKAKADRAKAKARARARANRAKAALYGICQSRVNSEEIKSTYPTYRWSRCTLGSSNQVYKLYKKPTGPAKSAIMLYNRNFKFYSGFKQRQWLVAPASASSRLRAAGWGGNNGETKPLLLGYGSTASWSSSAGVRTWLKNGGRDSKNHYLQSWVSLRQGKSPTGSGYKHAEKVFYVPA